MMPFLLAVPVWSPPLVVASEREVQAGDWFVMAHLGFFFFILCCFAVSAWLLWRRSNRPEPHLALLMDMEAEADLPRAETESNRETGDSREPWERKADWWRR